MFSLTQAVAQRGGESLFGILHLTQSARMASLGGNQVGLDGHDLSMLIHNPAMLNSGFSRNVSLSYVPYMADINYGFGGIAWDFEGVGTFALGFLHVGYGSFVAADESGIITGTFSAGESVMQITYSRPLSERWTAGFSIKPLYSRLESYDSWAIAVDGGLFYRNPNGLFTYGMVIRNFGRQLTSYHDGPLENLPPDLQLGVSYKLEHAPFRFSMTVQDLLTGSLDYVLPDSGNNRVIFGDGSNDDDLLDKMVKYLTLGVEFVPTNNFYVAAGVNPRRRQELRIESRTSTVGYTWGFGFKISKFNFSYGSGRYHLGGSSNHFSITTNLSSF